MGAKATKVGKRATTAKPAKRRSLVARLVRMLALATVALAALSIALVVSLRWLNPPITGVMLQRKLEAASAGQPTALTRRWCNLAQLGQQLPRAVIAAEDQRFMDHHGFDFVEIEKALEDARTGDGMRGASTITQQVAKNVFLTTHRSWLRKGLEVWFTLLIETFWSKQRVLEVHLNVAEWGPRLFGACAAADRYFHTSAEQLSRTQAAQLAVTLPAPLSRRPDQLGEYSNRRVQWILAQMPNVRVPMPQ